MKDRMKRLSVLLLSVSLCTGNVYAQDQKKPAETEAGSEAYTAETEMEKPTEPETIQAETAAPETEAPETAAPETEASESESTKESEPESIKESETEGTKEPETEGETQPPEMGDTETQQSETPTEKETSEACGESSDAEESSETENAEEKKELKAVDENGAELKKERLDVPETLTVGKETYPAEYMQGVYRIKVPADSRTIQIILPDQQDDEKVSLTRWGGYLTEAEHHWYLCPDDPEEAAFIQAGNVYTVNLDRFILKMEDLTREQIAVYGDLADDIQYAEVLVTGEGRSELLLVEFEEESETESEEGIATYAKSEPADGIATLSASASQVKRVYDTAGKNLSASSQKVTPTVGSIGGEWEILGLARSGKLDQDVISKYLANVVSTLKENNGVLHAKRYTDYSRVVLALTSIGVDVTNVGGYNLLKPLSDFDQTVWQGVNGSIWALIAFDSHDYKIPKAESGKTQNSREKLIQNILEQELSGGGWDLSGRSADPDVTAMALQSLAPYYSTDAQVKEAVDRGLKKLSSIQKKNGSFATYGSETSESCSQVIVALTALGIDPNTDSRFVKNGKSVVDALLTYANADGSFKHVLSGKANQMATEQAYYALTAYERFTGGKTRLYDMTDVGLPSDKEKAKIVENLITAIPDAVKLTDKAQIDGAKAMYDSLTDTQKTLVTNYSRLESAVKKLRELEKNNSGNGNENGNGNGNGKEDTNNKKNSGKKKTTGSTKKVNLVSGSGKTGGTPAGKTSSSTSSDKDSKDNGKEDSKKTTEKETEKASEKKGGTKTEKEVTSLITEINSLFRKTKASGKLPDHAADYTDAQKEQILDIYRTYSDLTDAQKKEVEQSSHYKDYEKAVESLKEANHYDEATDTDLRENEEDILPWYVQVEASSLKVDTDQAEQVDNALKGQGELLNLTDISLMDLLDNTEWEPEDLVRVSVPLVDLGDYENVAVVHLKDDGSLEFIEGHIAGKRIEFDTDRFSGFGIAGYNGSMEDLMKADEPMQKPVWMYLIPGAGAAVLLVFLGAARLIFSGKGKKKKGEESER